MVDFWRWAMSDLRMNTIRPMLAEFLVARAVGDPQRVRVEWANHDVTSAEGIRIEVKSTGYLQSWKQRKLSTPTFGRLSGRAWDPETATYGERPEIRADVFVFAIQTCRDPASYDVLDVGQWRFHVLAADIVKSCGTKTVGMGFVRKHAPSALSWNELRGAVVSVARAKASP